MKILLTGACGYVGSALTLKLTAAGHEVIGHDLQWFAYSPHMPPSDVRQITDLGGADCVIHLAAIANDPSVDFYPRRSWETACLATMRLAELASKSGARFIFASSVSVYGADRGLVTEDMDLRPLTDYNKTKMVAERVLLSYGNRVPVQIVRPATVCGMAPRMRLDLTVNMLTVQALRDRRMTLYGGDQMRPSIHIDDLCNLYLFLLDHPELTGIYNAGFENHSLIEIATMISAIIPSEIVLTPKRDDRSYEVDSAKLLTTGFYPQKSIVHAIHELDMAWKAGTLVDDARHYNLGYMTHLGLKDV